MTDDLRGRSRQQLEDELRTLQQQVDRIQEALEEKQSPERWWPDRFYLTYHVLVGGIAGLGAAIVSLLFNVIGSLMVGLHPLELIRVYLTFPLGEGALQTEDGFTLSAGCFLYLSTGMTFGAAIHVLLVRFFADRTLLRRLAIAAGLGLILWVVNFYLVLSWLQPLLFGDRWILTEIPFLVAAATHVLFAVLIAWIGSLSRFEPLKVPQR